MHLDVAHVGCPLHGRHGVRSAQEAQKRRIVLDAAQVGLEVGVVHAVEAHERVVKSQVEPREGVAREELGRAQRLLEAVLMPLVLYGILSPPNPLSPHA